MNDKILVITQCATHLICMLVSFYIIVPVIFHMIDFKGHCALFSCGQYIEDDGHFEPEWSPNGSCISSILIGFFTIVCCTAQCLLKLRLLYRNEDYTFLQAFVDFFLDCLVALFVLIDGTIVTLGFYKWCNCVTQRFSSCDIAASVMEIGVNSTIVVKNFPYQLGIVQFGAWALLVCIVFQLMLSTRKVFLHHERLNLIAGMSNERRRYQRQRNEESLDSLPEIQ